MGNPSRGTYGLGSSGPSIYATVTWGILPRGNYAQWGGYPFIHTYGPRSYFFGASIGQGSGFPLGSMFSLEGNPFGGIFDPGRNNVFGSTLS
jgi:hypothetical protein